MHGQQIGLALAEGRTDNDIISGKCIKNVVVLMNKGKGFFSVWLIVPDH